MRNKISCDFPNIKFYYFQLNREVETVNVEGIRIGKATFVDYILGSFRKSPPKISLSRVFRRGDDYFTARVGKRLVAIGRICYVNSKEITLVKGEASLMSFCTIPEYRRRGLYVSLIKEMLRYLKSKKFSRCYIWTDKKNKASLIGIEKAGFIPF